MRIHSIHQHIGRSHSQTKKGWKTIQTFGEKENTPNEICLKSEEKCFTNLLSARKYYKGWKAVLAFGKKGTKKENIRTEIYLSPEGKRFTNLMSARKHYVEELQNRTRKFHNKEGKNENITETLDIPDEIKERRKNVVRKSKYSNLLKRTLKKNINDATF